MIHVMILKIEYNIMHRYELRTMIVINTVCDDFISVKVLVPQNEVEKAIKGMLWLSNIICRRW